MQPVRFQACDLIQSQCQNGQCVYSHTDENEGQSDNKGKDVAFEGLVVLAITFGKHAKAGVDVVLT